MSPPPDHHSSNESAMAAAWLFNSLFLVGSLVIFYILLQYNRRKSTTRRRKRSKLVQTVLANIMIVFTIVRFAVTFLVIDDTAAFTDAATSAQQRDLACRWLLTATSCWLDLTVLPVFLFLWYRQQILYQQPLLAHLNTYVIKTISSVSLVFIVIKTPAHPAWFIASKHIRYDNVTAWQEAGCVIETRDGGSKWAGWLINMVMFAAIATLCVLYSVPLYHQVRSKQHHQVVKHTRTTRRLLRFTVSNLVCLAVCVGATLCSILVNNFVLVEGKYPPRAK